MKNKKLNLDEIMGAIRAFYSGSFLKFFLVLLLILSAGAGLYSILNSRQGDDASVEEYSSASQSSFFSSVGSAAEEALIRVFNGSDGGEELVEIVDVSNDSGAVNGDQPFSDAVTDEEENVDANADYESENSSSYTEEIVEEPEDTVIFCGFDTGGSPSLKGVLINEVAWMGGSSDVGLTSSDEWIELKNISDSPINIDNWQIVDQAEQVRAVLSGSISGGGFYLLERTDDGTVPGVSADTIYSGALSNTKEGIRLFDNNCVLVDEVFANPDWPAGDSSSRRTMQRENNLEWTTFGGSDTGGIWGTPRGENGEALPDENVLNEEVVPDDETAPPPETEVSGKININTAGYEQLQEITGVGPVIAQRIIDYRDANGPFQKIEDIKNVSGIGEVTFEKMKNQITVGG